MPRRSWLPVTREERIEQTKKWLEEELAHLFRPDGEVAQEIRQEVAQLLEVPVTLEGESMTARTNLGCWFKLVITAYRHGWQPHGSYVMPRGKTLTAEDARSFAEAVGKANPVGQGRSRLFMVAQLLGLRGAFEVLGMRRCGGRPRATVKGFTPLVKRAWTLLRPSFQPDNARPGPEMCERFDTSVSHSVLLQSFWRLLTDVT